MHPMRKLLADLDPEVVMLDASLDSAVVGAGERCGQPLLAIYSVKRLIELVQTQNRCDFDDAIEHVEFNIVGAWVGERTPIFLKDDLHERG